MNSRTCLLCGKALSRTGGGEDFCSYEHRSQYRLHRGLDRLNETVKPSALGHRDEFRALARPYAAGAGEPRMPDTRQIRNTSRLTDSDIQPLQLGWPHVQKPDWHSHIQSREVVRVAFPSAPPAARPREFQILRQPLQIRAGRELLRIAAATPGASHQARRTVQSAAAHKGLTPRVSLGVRFRLPVLRAWQYKGSSVSPPSLFWIEMQQTPAARDDAAVPQLQIAKFALRPPAPRPLPYRLPVPFGPPEMRPMSARVAPGTAESHEATMPLGHQEAARPTLRIAVRREEHPRSFVHPIQPPLSIHAAHRITEVRFTAQDSKVSPVEEF